MIFEIISLITFAWLLGKCVVCYAVDRKYDDGIYNNADFRTACCGGNGVEWFFAIKEKCACNRYSYIIWNNH